MTEVVEAHRVEAGVGGGGIEGPNRVEAGTASTLVLSTIVPYSKQGAKAGDAGACDRYVVEAKLAETGTSV